MFSFPAFVDLHRFFASRTDQPGNRRRNGHTGGITGHVRVSDRTPLDPGTPLMPIFFTAARSASRPHTSAERFLGSGFAAVWLLVWSLITLAFDGIIVVMVAQTMLAWSYPSVPGTITHSEIRREMASEGDAFHADLKYQYVVNGQDFIGERRSFFNMSWNSSRAASRIIRSLPVGQQVEVFYNPRDPHDAA